MSMTMGQLASKLAEASSKVEVNLDTNLQQFVQAGVGIMKRTIQEMHAVDTATMLNSTTSEKVGDSTYLIGPTVDYAVYVALGTSRMAARPFHTVSARKLANQAGHFDLNLGV